MMNHKNEIFELDKLENERKEIIRELKYSTGIRKLTLYQQLSKNRTLLNITKQNVPMHNFIGCLFGYWFNDKIVRLKESYTATIKYEYNFSNLSIKHLDVIIAILYLSKQKHKRIPLNKLRTIYLEKSNELIKVDISKMGFEGTHKNPICIETNWSELAKVMNKSPGGTFSNQAKSLLTNLTGITIRYDVLKHQKQLLSGADSLISWTNFQNKLYIMVNYYDSYVINSYLQKVKPRTNAALGYFSLCYRNYLTLSKNARIVYIYLRFKNYQNRHKYYTVSQFVEIFHNEEQILLFDLYAQKRKKFEYKLRKIFKEVNEKTEYIIKESKKIYLKKQIDNRDVVFEVKVKIRN